MGYTEIDFPYQPSSRVGSQIVCTQDHPFGAAAHQFSGFLWHHGTSDPGGSWYCQVWLISSPKNWWKVLYKVIKSMFTLYFQVFHCSIYFEVATHTCIYIYIFTHTHVYIYIFIYLLYRHTFIVETHILATTIVLGNGTHSWKKHMVVQIGRQDSKFITFDCPICHGKLQLRNEIEINPKGIKCSCNPCSVKLTKTDKTMNVSRDDNGDIKLDSEDHSISFSWNRQITPEDQKTKSTNRMIRDVMGVPRSNQICSINDLDQLIRDFWVNINCFLNFLNSYTSYETSGSGLKPPKSNMGKGENY